MEVALAAHFQIQVGSVAQVKLTAILGMFTVCLTKAHVHPMVGQSQLWDANGSASCTTLIVHMDTRQHL